MNRQVIQMRYDVGLPRERILELESVVDAIIGIEEESWEYEGTVFHRDDESIAGIMTEQDIKGIAENMEYQGRWLGFSVSNALTMGIERVETASMKRLNLNDQEYRLLRQDFLERLASRLKRYEKDHRLAIDDKGGEVVGLRWE